MFGKLGEVLKKGIDRIASAVFVDKELIDSIVKDLQRALIEADVNVVLVKEISEKIRKAAVDERVKGIEKKEHIIKILHDELKSILGGEKHELEFKKGKLQKIMLLGLYGAGKCVHGKSKIQLSNGNIQEISEIYEAHKENGEEELNDGKIINIEDKKIYVPSFNPKTLKIENKKVTHLWKLNKKELYEIKVDNGNDFSVKVTPEHPFFVLRGGKVEKVRSDEIKETDYISIPKDIAVSGSTINLSEKIKKLDLSAYLSKEEVKEIISNKKQQIKEICKNLSHSRNYCQLTLDLKEGKIPIELVNLKELNMIRVKENKSKKVVTIPLFLTQEFAEFLGYLMGDGHIGTNYLEIVNEDSEIIKRVAELSTVLFNITPKVKHDKRTKKMFRILLCSKTLVRVMSIFGLNPGAKGKKLKIPEEVLMSNRETIKQFIRGYFDCDSSPTKNRRQIEFVSESPILIKQMEMLLLRFGIISTISKKIINSVPYWRLIIKARYAESYAENIGYLIKHKKERAEKFKIIGSLEGCGNQDMIPLGKILKEIRLKNGFSIGEIQTNAVYSYGRYEEKGLISREKLLKLVNYYKLKKKGIFANLLSDISNNTVLKERYSNAFINGSFNYLKNNGIIEKNSEGIILTNNGKMFLEQINKEEEYSLDTFEYLALSNICWIPVKEIKKIENDFPFVYDLTIEDNHSFIADGFIVHNTTTISKLAAYYAKRGYKTCMLGLDVHRPAASDQLEQLAQRNNLVAFINKKEKNPLKIYQEFEDKIKNYDLCFVDTAGRDVLDKELVKEIKDLGKKIKPDYIILVMPADIGQAAKRQATEFQKTLSINGVIITRMDSTAKGGGALTACSETQAPVYFITTGEQINDLETFDPSSFISRMLGMGDLNSLLEKVTSVVDEKKQKNMQDRLKEGKFTMLDLYEQLKSMEGLGSLSKIKNLIPGLGNAKISDEMLGTQEDKLKKFKFAIQSMTKEEIENPELIEKQTQRLARIAKGAGVNTSDVRALLKQHKMIKEFAKSGIAGGDLSQGFSEKQMQKLARKFGKKMRM